MSTYELISAWLGTMTSKFFRPVDAYWQSIFADKTDSDAGHDAAVYALWLFALCGDFLLLQMAISMKSLVAVSFFIGLGADILFGFAAYLMIGFQIWYKKQGKVIPAIIPLIYLMSAWGWVFMTTFVAEPIGVGDFIWSVIALLFSVVWAWRGWMAYQPE